MARIAFRVDASSQVGLGHLSRCLALATALRGHGAACHFIGTTDMQPWAGSVKAAGHSLSLIEAGDQADDARQTARALASDCPVEWLVVDHYRLDAQWHDRIRCVTRRLLAIDDLADRPLRVDAVLDPSPCASESGYRALASAGCKLLLGPRYCLLRQEFAHARASQIWPRDGVDKIHLALGGTDAAGHTVPMTARLLAWFEHARLVAVLGTSGPQARALAVLGEQFPGRLEVVVATDAMARTMIGCTAAVGAPGGSLWERCCMGIPSACVITSASQRPVVEKLAEAGWLLKLGDAAEFAVAARKPLEAWLHAREARKAQRHFLMAQVDGQGAERVAAWMMEPA